MALATIIVAIASNVAPLFTDILAMRTILLCSELA